MRKFDSLSPGHARTTINRTIRTRACNLSVQFQTEGNDGVVMPKGRTRKKCEAFVTQFGSETFSTDGAVLFCKVCEKTVNSEKKYFVQQHVRSSIHKSRKDRKYGSLAQQVPLLPNFLEASNKVDDFYMELCQALVKSNIPLYKLQNPFFRSFLEKYTKKVIPHYSTLRKTYLKKIYEATVEKIRSSRLAKLRTQEASMW